MTDIDKNQAENAPADAGEPSNIIPLRAPAPAPEPIESSNDPGMTDSMPSDPVAVGLEAVVAGQVEDAQRVIIPGFDPAIHAVNPDGTPKMRADGSGFALRRGRKKGDSPGQSVNRARESAPIATEAGAAPVDPQLIAAAYWSAALSVAVGVFGDEWLPESQAENKQMVGTLAAYLEATGKTDIPPGLALSLAVVGYGFKRYQKKASTYDKVRFIGMKIRDWISARLKKRGVIGG